jgi:putative N6-adenine-specific DNA methylase
VPSVAPLSVLAAAQPGLEGLVHGELAQLGIANRIVAGIGANFEGTQIDLYLANLHLRCASRVLLYLPSFRAATFQQLVRRTRALPWEEFLAAGEPVRVRVSCRKSRLYHSGAVAERVVEAIAARSGAATAPPQSDEAQLVVVRLERDICQLAVDSSGAHLHQRGYRQAVTQAPLRETLAAAMLLASGWDGRYPLVDPFCGSGTIAIEAALLARRMAPGRQRRFRFMRWPCFDPSLWELLLERALGGELASSPAPIYASDRNGWAVRAARENATRAGVGGDLSVERLDVADLGPPAGRGWLVSNPPYGLRLGGAAGEALQLLLQVASSRFAGWKLALLVPLGLSGALPGSWLKAVLRTFNGGLPVRLHAGCVPHSAGPPPAEGLPQGVNSPA